MAENKHEWRSCRRNDDGQNGQEDKADEKQEEEAEGKADDEEDDGWGKDWSGIPENEREQADDRVRNRVKKPEPQPDDDKRDDWHKPDRTKTFPGKAKEAMSLFVPKMSPPTSPPPPCLIIRTVFLFRMHMCSVGERWQTIVVILSFRFV